MGITFELYTGNEHGVISPSCKPNTAYLKANTWDDFGYKTLFMLVVFDSNGLKHDIGPVKIGHINHPSGYIYKDIDKTFNSLSNEFFSLGQSEKYYSKINSLNPKLKKNILKSLKDIVYDEKIKKLALTQGVFKTSLLRDISLTSINGQFKRILNGGSIQTEFHFEYQILQGPKTAGLSLEFHVDPESNPPSNVHVLIGRNGVGKTHLLNNMVKALVDDEKNIKQSGSFSSNDSPETIFAGVVSVAFSAFDPFDPLPEKKDKSEGIRYSYIGLKRTTNRGGERGTPMSREMLTNVFSKSVVATIQKDNSDRWLEAIRSLESDPLFRELALSKEFIELEGEPLDKFAKSTFNRLSSGHAIVLLTISKLVETVEEKTLVLLDEPEAHLHPPLLSAFIRSLSDLLSHKNGVAIIATHSPVILQEVPRNCVYKMNRSGLVAKPERPNIETFGENIGVLTREIFGLEVTNSGYHNLLLEELKSSTSYKTILRRFNGQLGSEAKGVLRSLILTNEQ